MIQQVQSGARAYPNHSLKQPTYSLFPATAANNMAHLSPKQRADMLHLQVQQTVNLRQKMIAADVPNTTAQYGRHEPQKLKRNGPLKRKTHKMCVIM